MPKEYKTWINDDYDLLPVEMLAEHCFLSKEEAKQFCLGAVFSIAARIKITFHIYEMNGIDEIHFFIDNYKMARVYPCYENT